MARLSRNSSNFECTTTTLMLGLFRALGLAPFSVQKSSNPMSSKKKAWRGSAPIKFVSSRVGCFYNVFMIALQFRMLFIAIPLLNELDDPDKMLLTSTIENAGTAIGNVVLFVVWLSLGFRQKTLVKIFNRLSSFNGATFYHNYDNFSDSSRTFFVMIFLMNIILWTVSLCTDLLAYQTLVLTWFTAEVPCFVLTWFVTQYIFAVKFVEKGFRALNRYLVEKSVNSSAVCDDRFFIARLAPINDSNVVKIQTIRRAHTNLYEIAMDISDFYSLPILLTIAFYSYTAICVSYYLVLPFVVAVEKQSNLMTVNSIFTIVTVILPIAMLATGVSNVTKEIRNTADVVRGLLARSTTSRHDVIELKQFAMELLHRKIDFTACGLFPLDRTLLHSIFSMVTSYLTILIQFHMESNKTTSNRENGSTCSNVCTLETGVSQSAKQ